MKYNFVILATTFDWYKIMYSEILGRFDVRFYQDMSDFLSPVEQKLYRIHHSKKINHFMPLPGRKLWFKKVMRQLDFGNDNPICFIWYSHFVREIKRGMLDYIKEVLPDSKHVMYYTDAKNVNTEELQWLKGKMDEIGVFDPGVAEKYELRFWPNVYPGKPDDGAKLEFDLCFIGNDKGRLGKLVQLAEECKKHQVRSAFYIKSKEKITNCDNICYIEEYLPYEQVVDIVKRSRTLLELKTEPYETWSVRAQEAIVFNKKILTDNRNINHMPCKVNTNAISIFDKIEDIDWEFVKADMDVDYGYHNEFSATAFLENIERLIQ